MKRLINIVKNVFSIIGSVIGAGFISGKEIITFFYGFNSIFVGFFIFILFFIGLSFLLTIKREPNCSIMKIFKFLMLVGNLIITSGMLSAIDEIAFKILKIPTFLSIFSILSLIAAYFILLNGVEGLKYVNTAVVPLMIFSTLSVLIIKSDAVIIPFGKISVIFPLMYMGINLYMSSTLFINLGEDKRFIDGIIVAFISAFILAFFVFYMLSALSSEGNNIIYSSLPMLVFLENNLFLTTFFGIVMYFGIFTTLLSSLYPLIREAEHYKNKKIIQIIILIIAFVLSRIGFSQIVNKLYPIIGAIGCIYLVVLAIIKIFNNKKINFINNNL